MFCDKFVKCGFNEEHARKNKTPLRMQKHVVLENGEEAVPFLDKSSRRLSSLQDSCSDPGRPITPPNVTLIMTQPRKLCFDNEDMDCSDEEPSDVAPKVLVNGCPTDLINVNQDQSWDGEKTDGGSPPYRKVRALRLHDSPATPKTLVKKSTLQTPVLTKLYPDRKKPRPVAMYYKADNKPTANINPFTPNGMKITARKRTRSKSNLVRSPSKLRIPKFELSDESDQELEQPTKRVALQESNISRYYKEFIEEELLGTGNFGSVFKCIHKLDGCYYALKKSIKPVAGSANEKSALNEVYAHAVLGKHQHVVRYYSAWAEDDHMIIQNEYCNGGSLADVIQKLRAEDKYYTETELRQLLLQVAEGLRYIHSMNLVHMDIKPANIFISREKSQRVNYDSADDGFDEEEPEEELTYKIGDLGHVTSITNPVVEEGDCRYFPCEILEDDYKHLTKADIFALGLTIYEAAGAGPLPLNGPEWHDIRNGKLKELTRYTKDFNQLIKAMIDRDPDKRPSALNLVQHRVVSSNGNKTKAQLQRELNAERLKNEILSKQLEEAAKCLKTIAPNLGISNTPTPINTGYKLRSTVAKTNSNRAVGKKIHRSASATNF